MLTGLETTLLSGGTALIGATVTAIIALIRSGIMSPKNSASAGHWDDQFDKIEKGQTEQMVAITNHVSGLQDEIRDMVGEQKITNVLLRERLPRRGSS